MEASNPKNNKRGESHKRINGKYKSTSEKKPFDKKKYRLQKYSNKYKGDCRGFFRLDS